MKSYALTFLIFLLGLFSKNKLIYISAGVLLLFSVLNLLPNSPWAQKVLMDTGIVLLVMGVLMPLGCGQWSCGDLYQSIFSLEGFIAFLVGIASAVMAKDGVFLMKKSPGVMIGLLFGSIISAAFFSGIPTGPLVAAGLAAFILKAIEIVKIFILK